MQSSTGIHCKVACNNQYRRFLFVGTEFCSLYCQVKSLLNLNEKEEFVLKYKDNEGDMITISSDEELACALSLTSGSLLRLSASVASSENEKPTITDIPVSCEFEICSPHGGYARGPCARKFYGRGRGGRCGPWAGRCGPYERMNQCEEPGPYGRKPWRRDCRKAKLTYKREVIQSILNELAQCAERGELRPDQLRKQAHLKAKLCNIDCRLKELCADDKMEQCDKPTDCQEEKCKDKCQDEEEKCKDKCQNEEEKCWRKCRKDEEKCKDKAEKHKRKCEKKSRKCYKEKKNQKPLSDEVKAEIEEVKACIATLKQPLKEIKGQIKNKKQAWRDANEHDAQLLACEIADLKKQSLEYKKQIQPLRQRIQEMYHGGSC